MFSTASYTGQHYTNRTILIPTCNLSAADIAHDINPNHKPGSIGAMLIFHTKTGIYVLGRLRHNPALADTINNNLPSFPMQINTTLCSALLNTTIPLKTAMLDIIQMKLFLTPSLSGSSLPESLSQALQPLCDAIEQEEGWENIVCVTNDVQNNMCTLTAIKHIACEEADLIQIQLTLKQILALKKEEEVNPLLLHPFAFVPLKPVIHNALAYHQENALIKAARAQEQYGNAVTISFNDKVIATLAKQHAFTWLHPALLHPSHRGLRLC